MGLWQIKMKNKSIRQMTNKNLKYNIKNDVKDCEQFESGQLHNKSILNIGLFPNSIGID